MNSIVERMMDIQKEKDTAIRNATIEQLTEQEAKEIVRALMDFINK